MDIKYPALHGKWRCFVSDGRSLRRPVWRFSQQPAASLLASVSAAAEGIKHAGDQGHSSGRCSNTTELTLPEGLKHIGVGAFQFRVLVRSITELNMRKGLHHIEGCRAGAEEHDAALAQQHAVHLHLARYLAGRISAQLTSMPSTGMRQSCMSTHTTKSKHAVQARVGAGPMPLGPCSLVFVLAPHPVSDVYVHVVLVAQQACWTQSNRQRPHLSHSWPLLGKPAPHIQKPPFAYPLSRCQTYIARDPTFRIEGNTWLLLR